MFVMPGLVSSTYFTPVLKSEKENKAAWQESGAGVSVDIVASSITVNNILSPAPKHDSEDEPSNESFMDNLIGPDDNYSLYNYQLEMKDSLTGEKKKEVKKKEEPEIVKTVKHALKTIFEVAMKAFSHGLVPHVERERRSAEGSKRTYLEWFINFVGALLGKQECTKILACRSVLLSLLSRWIF